MYQPPDWESVDDLLQRVQRHQSRRDDYESLERARSDLAVLRHIERVKEMQRTYSRGRA